MCEDDEPFARPPVDVRLRHLPRGLVELRVPLRGADASCVIHELPVPEEREAPAVTVPAFVGPALGRVPEESEVRELLEQLVVHRAVADRPEEPAHLSLGDSPSGINLLPSGARR